MATSYVCTRRTWWRIGAESISKCDVRATRLAVFNRHTQPIRIVHQMHITPEPEYETSSDLRAHNAGEQLLLRWIYLFEDDFLWPRPSRDSVPRPPTSGFFGTDDRRRFPTKRFKTSAQLGSAPSQRVVAPDTASYILPSDLLVQPGPAPYLISTLHRVAYASSVMISDHQHRRVVWRK